MGLRPSLLPGGLFHRDRESPPPPASASLSRCDNSRHVCVVSRPWCGVSRAVGGPRDASQVQPRLVKTLDYLGWMGLSVWVNKVTL